MTDDEKPRSIRFTADMLAQIDELARLWGPVVPLKFSHVIQESVRRCHQAQLEAEKKNRKKSPVGG